MSESKLVKISKIHLYVGFTEDAKECYDVIKWFRDNSIPYILLNYSDQDQAHKANFDALSTWGFGPDKVQRTLRRYPIVVWEENYDDWSTQIKVAQGLQELIESDLLSNKNIIQP